MEYIIKNAKIATMDKENPFAESAIVKDGKFAFCGAQSEAEKLVSAETEVTVTENGCNDDKGDDVAKTVVAQQTSTVAVHDG